MELCALEDLLIKRKILLPASASWNQLTYQRVELETSTVCNWRCEFCPSVQMKRKPQYIDWNLYQDILDKVAAYKHVKIVYLHGLNEPTIDPRFEDLVNEIIKRNLKFGLFTNDSGLNDEKILFLKRIQKDLVHIAFNLPSANKDHFKSITGTKNFTQTIQTIKKCFDAKFNIYLSVQGLKEEKAQEIEYIKKTFGNVKIYSDITFDRAGVLQNQYAQNISIQKPKLSGCFLFSDTLIIRMNGDLHICCNNVNGQLVYANIRDGSFEEIFKKPAYQNLLKKIFGGQIAEASFLCRKCILAQRN